MVQPHCAMNVNGSPAGFMATRAGKAPGVVWTRSTMYWSNISITIRDSTVATNLLQPGRRRRAISSVGLEIALHPVGEAVTGL